ncbi:MAG: RdgB/HAM1 family non-canonical purine NTP pyrophosphatase [Spirochaetales bacterium]|nr:RdgB/HAM1 family non-canonical purine NTP pyrophosphatase [Spirochaetales bacterium]
MEILFASGNRHKQKEMQQILSGHTILLPADLCISFDPEETGDSFFANAWIKAEALFNISGKAVLADDSGLVVDALDGAPGIYSARYGNEKFGKILSASERNDYLLGKMKGEKLRSARFVCCLILYLDTYRFAVSQETVEGLICSSPSGINGFGYDPVFYIPEYNCTMAELPEHEKNRISHRGKAAENIHHLL